MKNIVIYTCVTRGYDDYLTRPAKQSRDVSFICFTDDRLFEKNGWTLQGLKQPSSINRPDLINRYHKFFPHVLFPDADCSIYIDGNLEITGDMIPLIKGLIKSGSALSFLKHPGHSTLEDEIAACIRLNKFKGDDISMLDAQKEFYLREGLPENHPHFRASILLRDHRNEMLAPAMSLWWEQLLNYTGRDQLSLPYVIWKSKVPYTVIDKNDSWQNIYFKKKSHSKSVEYWYSPIVKYLKKGIKSLLIKASLLPR